jgi:6-pyruvoyltetrahydropterin/6-carboxytetrahydropterin synthase
MGGLARARADSIPGVSAAAARGLEARGAGPARGPPGAPRPARARRGSASAAPLPSAGVESWSIDLSKEAFQFSCAHFLIFPDGSSERLHGHNYRVYVEIDAQLSEFGLVIDFRAVKPVVREIVDGLDEHWLVPGEHPVLTCRARGDGVIEVRYRDKHYAAPEEDVLVLPINNTSSENLASWIGRELRRLLGERFEAVRVASLRVAVEETSGQCGVYHYRAEETEARG